jgi:hypothetical protein
MDTLHDTMLKHAKEWTEEDLVQIVAGLREQRERWNAEQSVGSRKRVPSTKVAVKAKPKTVASVMKFTL